MKVHHSLENLPEIKNPVLTIGTFDGVHIGHQAVLKQLNELATTVNGETVVFTFHPHPRIALNPDDHGLVLIQSMEDRIAKLEKLKVDHLILFPFTKEFSRMTATEFVRNVLVNQIHIHTLTIGYNHHFGRNREGNIELLRELAPVYGFNVVEIPALSESNKNVSSTKIREAIQSGNMEEAALFLAETFKFKGKVVGGDQLGTKIGYPTANVQIDALQLVPDQGVFAVRVKYKNTVHSGMMNIGRRPTVAVEGERRIEIHVFDFNDRIYGEEIEIFILEKIRDEQNFPSLEALKEQLKKDEEKCRLVLQHHSLVEL